MTNSSRHSKIRKIWFPLLLSFLILFYVLWWFVFLYTPYCRKRDALRPQILALEQEIDRKKTDLKEFKMTEERLNISMAPFNLIRSRLPHIKDLKKFIAHLKKRGIEYHLLVDKVSYAPHISHPPYPPEASIQPVNMTFELKGDFLSIGRFIQYLDEEERHFCHLRNVSMKRSADRNYNVWAQIKMAVFCQKEEGGRDGVF